MAVFILVIIILHTVGTTFVGWCTVTVPTKGARIFLLCCFTFLVIIGTLEAMHFLKLHS